MTPAPDRLLWVDLETTGLDPEKDLVLEVAAIVTEHEGDDLREVARYTAVTDEARKRNLWMLHSAVQAMHEKNGLWMESMLRGRPLEGNDGVRAEFYRFVRDNAAGAQLAGSTISFDRSFMKVHLSGALACLHYRNLDVSSFNEAARRWWPEVYEARPKRGDATHRAVDDILESIECFRHYLRSLAVRQ